MDITIPHNFKPRDYQLPLLQALDGKYKRAVCVWHRRAGKDKTLINIIAKKMFERVGAYYYFLPTYSQGKKIIWEGLDKNGFKFLDHIPEEVRKSTNNTEMMIETVNGSIFRVIGSDRIDSIVGTNPIGCVFSEYALQDPRAWDYIRPILAENGGWAVFNFTPRGDNHGKDLFDLAKSDPDFWFAQKLTVEDTHTIPEKTLGREKREMFERTGNDALFMQEYYCSFDAPIEGAYYAVQMMNVQKEGRIQKLPYETNLKVHTAWDLGVGDSTAIWFFQSVGREIRLIDYYETSGEGLAHYAKVLQEKGYVYGDHIAPHDIEVRELGTGKSRLEVARDLGIRFKIAPKMSLDDGIQATRDILSRCYFDEEKCKQGINCLRSYHKAYDEKNGVYKSYPVHDWTSHGADAFRYLAVGFRQYQEYTQDDIPRFVPSDPVIGV